MATFLDRLNLRPQERRVLLAVALVLFVLLNLLFVWPMLPDWKRSDAQIEKARKTFDDYRREIALMPTNKIRLLELEKQGSTVLREEQALDLVRTIQTKANDAGVTVTRTQPGIFGGSATNRYFDEQSVMVDVTTKDQELIEFLFALGSGDSMIRVRQLDLKPDPPQYRLIGKLELVASYLKKVNPPPPATPKPTAAPANKPAVSIRPAPSAGTTNKSKS